VAGGSIPQQALGKIDQIDAGRSGRWLRRCMRRCELGFRQENYGLAEFPSIHFIAGHLTPWLEALWTHAL
jgi:hypothetical protein